ncbi:DeoR/GlpR family DNA-binding transcription regulator [Pontibacter silvestris]|uniref:DeoR/GlpR family DNA-binding transcription regulator n=1 Tax=Pontibacter silvestris TaxID=2305183 RepID=A0ABW4WS54_9BACT|nr:DeoR/GlpR family DNA-binding transcription regulator [Pontibacter silvestris]MCC9137864.1 DeoR/GlpR family DNA-binding transcription regulator [Pontibacter silvestris]
MLKQERHNYILEEVRSHNKVLSSELSHKLNVSEDTIRRDLKELSDNGQIKKVHGGAMQHAYIPFSHKDREIYAHEEKVVIVRKAIPLIQDDFVVVMDGGTTNLELARQLPLDLKATVFTNSLPIALQLSEHPKVETVFIGGKILKNAQVAVGLDVINFVADIHADICFIGTRSIHHQFGITDFDREETLTKQALVSCAKHVVSLPISEKINTVQPYKVTGIEKVQTLITELASEDDLLTAYRKRGLQVL